MPIWNLIFEHLRTLYGVLSADIDKSVWFDTKMDLNDILYIKLTVPLLESEHNEELTQR